MFQNYQKVTEGICNSQGTVIISFLLLSLFNDDKEDYGGSSQVQKLSIAASVTPEWIATRHPNSTLFSQVAI